MLLCSIFQFQITGQLVRPSHLFFISISCFLSCIIFFSLIWIPFRMHDFHGIHDRFQLGSYSDHMLILYFYIPRNTNYQEKVFMFIKMGLKTIRLCFMWPIHCVRLMHKRVWLDIKGSMITTSRWVHLVIHKDLGNVISIFPWIWLFFHVKILPTWQTSLNEKIWEILSFFYAYEPLLFYLLDLA